MLYPVPGTHLVRFQPLICVPSLPDSIILYLLFLLRATSPICLAQRYPRILGLKPTSPRRTLRAFFPRCRQFETKLYPFFLLYLLPHQLRCNGVAVLELGYLELTTVDTEPWYSLLRRYTQLDYSLDSCSSRVYESRSLQLDSIGNLITQARRLPYAFSYQRFPAWSRPAIGGIHSKSRVALTGCIHSRISICATTFLYSVLWTHNAGPLLLGPEDCCLVVASIITDSARLVDTRDNCFS
jgi:hypothetical protein